jgi:hypothetical protein
MKTFPKFGFPKTAFFLFLALLISCKEQSNKKDRVLSEIVIENIAQRHYGGKKRVVLEDKKEIKEFYCLLKENKFVGHANNMINNNKGFLVIYEGYEDCSLKELVSIIYTVHNGDIVRKAGANYYKNEELVDFINDKLGNEKSR